MAPMMMSVKTGFSLAWRIAIGALTLAVLLLASSGRSNTGASPLTAPGDVPAKAEFGTNKTLLSGVTAPDDEQFVVVSWCRRSWPPTRPLLHEPPAHAPEGEREEEPRVR